MPSLKKRKKNKLLYTRQHSCINLKCVGKTIPPLQKYIQTKWCSLNCWGRLSSELGEGKGFGLWGRGKKEGWLGNCRHKTWATTVPWECNEASPLDRRWSKTNMHWRERTEPRCVCVSEAIGLTGGWSCGVWEWGRAEICKSECSFLIHFLLIKFSGRVGQRRCRVLSSKKRLWQSTFLEYFC